MSNTDNSTPRQIPLFQAGMRPRQWWGVNWYLMAALVGSCSVTELFSIGLKLWLVAVVCPVVFFFGLRALRSFSRRDPHFFHVYWRAARYRDYYPAKTSLCSATQVARRSWI
jgi:type IV secretory pathway TrbD component